MALLGLLFIMSGIILILRDHQGRANKRRKR
jgi:hypothetical protein